MQKYTAKFAKHNAAIIAITSQSNNTIKKLKQRLKLTFPILSDASLKVTKQFGVAGRSIPLPAAFIVGPTGEIEWGEEATVRKRPAESKLLALIAAVAKKYKANKGKTPARNTTTKRPTPRR